MKNIYIITGGTMVHVSPHFSLCAPAYGKVGVEILDNLNAILDSNDNLSNDYSVHIIPTRMAGNVDYNQVPLDILDSAGIKGLPETNEDIDKVVDHLISLPDTRSIIMAAAICDFVPKNIRALKGMKGSIEATNFSFGKGESRLSSKENYSLSIKGETNKIIYKIRKERKDIFLVSFKTTAGVGFDETYKKGLESLKKSSSNLVFANDIQHKINIVITPEEYPYEYESREESVYELCEMIMDRIQLTFNRTPLVPGQRADIDSLYRNENIPSNFKDVLHFLIEKNAYKPFLGKTSGHFGCKVSGLEFDRISSVRKEDHNDVFKNGMSKIFVKKDGIIAVGAKPSVGEHTQQAIYDSLEDKVDSIIHFHSPLKEGKDVISIRPQKSFECGSNECSSNSVMGLEKYENGIYAVHLENHGPNIAFSKDASFTNIINFIEKYWDLSDKTGGLIK